MLMEKANQIFYVTKLFKSVCDCVHGRTTNLQKLRGEMKPAIAELVNKTAVFPQPLRQPFLLSDNSL